MNIQTIFKAGNSPYVMSIPKALAEDWGIKTGQKVVVNKIDDETLVVKKISKVGNNKKAAQADFDAWLKRFFKENGEALDKLAIR